MAKAKGKSRHISDTASDKLAHLERKVSGEDTVPGPSTDPSTNLIIHDIILRSAGRLTRTTLEKALLGRRYGSQFAKDVVDNRSLLHTLAAYGVTKMATRSLPGALVVGGGLLVKTLFDRSRSRRKAEKSGDAMLEEQSKPDGML